MIARATLKGTFPKEGQETELRAKTGPPQLEERSYLSSRDEGKDENMSIEMLLSSSVQLGSPLSAH